MRWPWQRKKRGSRDVDEAQAEAHRALIDAKNFSRRVEATAEAAHRTRLRNHIAESIEIAIIIPPRRAE